MSPPSSQAAAPHKSRTQQADNFRRISPRLQDTCIGQVRDPGESNPHRNLIRTWECVMGGVAGVAGGEDEDAVGGVAADERTVAFL